MDLKVIGNDNNCFRLIENETPGVHDFIEFTVSKYSCEAYVWEYVRVNERGDKSLVDAGLINSRNDVIGWARLKFDTRGQ